jgi:uncharacterized protein YdeI (BOF family)
MKRIVTNEYCSIFLILFAIFSLCVADVSNADPTNMGPINSAETKTGSLSLSPSENSENMWTFSGNEGDRVLITVSELSGNIEPQIFLYSPSGELEVSAELNSLSQTLDHQLNESGLYTIIINDRNLDEEGQYALALVKLPGAVTSAADPDGGPIESAETLTGNLTLQADTDVFQFNGESGERVVITVSELSGNVEPQVFLYPPDSGELEVSAELNSLSQTLDHQLNESGLYTIIINDRNLDEEGQYALALVKLPGAVTSAADPDGGPIASAETLTGELTLQADTDVFQFNGESGDRVVITVSELSGNVEPQVFLYPPDSGELEASAENYSLSQTLDHQLNASGLYTILIKDSYMDEEGEFELSFEKDPPEKRLGIYQPFPSGKASIPITCAQFSWDPVPGANGYDLYFGEDVIAPLDLIGEDLPAPNMAFPETMAPYTVYYWHVVAHTASGNVQGPVWWFETDAFLGDFDNDGDVDGEDLSVFAAAMQIYNAAADFNNDNFVDEQDLLKFLCNFGKAGIVSPVSEAYSD